MCLTSDYVSQGRILELPEHHDIIQVLDTSGSAVCAGCFNPQKAMFGKLPGPCDMRLAHLEKETNQMEAGKHLSMVSERLGCWLSDPCNYYLDCRGADFISTVFCVLTPIGDDHS